MDLIEHEGVTHHLPESLMIAYAAGRLSPGFSLVVAAHVALCLDCRADLGLHETIGGALVADLAATPVPPALRERVFDQLDDRVPEPAVFPRQGPLPAPVMTALRGEAPVWKPLGDGLRQCTLAEGARLLSLPPGHAIPEHGHRGLELTQVLRGTFFDDTGTYVTGDIQVAEAGLTHSPVAAPGPACLCLTATDGPLRFRRLFPSLLAPLFRS